MATSRDRSPKLVAVVESDVGQRIDNFLLKKLKGVPKSHVYRIMRSGEVRVNSKRIRASYRLAENDIVRIPPVRMAAPRSENVPSKSLQALLAKSIIYEDKDLLAINKPSGIAVHGGSGVLFGVIEIMRSLNSVYGSLELVHRLDRETSGCLLLAKKRSVLVALQKQFQAGQMQKTYLALLKGRWQGRARKVEQSLHKYRTQDGESMVKIVEHGKRAITEFIPEKPADIASLMRVILHTGRTHQIRVHSAFLGRPIACDQKYGDRMFNKNMKALGLRRMFLHAYQLKFSHPITGQQLAINADLSVELQQFLQTILRKGGETRLDSPS